MYSQNNNLIEKISEKYQFYKQDILKSNLGEDLCNQLSENNKKSFFKYQEFLYQYMKDLNDFSNEGNQIDNRGIFVYHGLGSGKTTSGIILTESCRNYKLNDEEEHYKTKPEYLRKVILMIPANLFFDPWIKEISSKCYSNCQIRDAINKILKENENITEKKLKKIIVDKLQEFDFHIIYYNAFTLKGGYKDKLLDIPNRKTTTDKYINKYSENINPFDDAVILIDECHNLINMISNKLKDNKEIELYDDLFNARNARVILLSSTPIINDIFEIAILSNIIRGKINKRNNIKFSNNYDEFRNTFIDEDNLILKNTNMLKRRFNGLISYNKGINENVFAKQIIENVYLPFSSDQQEGYMFAESLIRKQKQDETMMQYDQSSLLKRKASNIIFPKYLFNQKILNEKKLTKNQKSFNPIAINNKNYLLDTTITKDIEKQIIQILDNDDKPLNINNDLHNISKKVYHIIKKIKESNGPVLVYSKFEGLYGIRFIEEALKQNGFNQFKKSNDSSLLDGTYIKWTGKDRNNSHKEIFNSIKNKDGKIIKVFLMTSSGKEGINLFSIRQIHILEPWWNNTIIKQIIGRGIRICSHNHIPKNNFIDTRFKKELRVFNDRFVNIFKYFTFLDLRNNDISKSKDIIKKEMKSRSIDFKIKEKADTKEKMEKQLLYLLKEIAIDCDINYDRNNEGILCYIDKTNKNYFDSWDVTDDDIKIVKKKYNKLKIDNQLYVTDQFNNIYDIKNIVNVDFNNLDNDVVKIGKYENNKIIYDNNFYKNNKLQNIPKSKSIKNYIMQIMIKNNISLNQNIDYTGIYDKNLILLLKSFKKVNFYTNQNIDKINKLNNLENKISIKKEDDVLVNDILVINKSNYDIEKTLNNFNDKKFILVLNISIQSDILLFNKNTYYPKYNILLISNNFKSDLHKLVKELDTDINNKIKLMKDLNKININTVDKLYKYLKNESKLDDIFNILKIKLNIKDDITTDIKNFNDCMKMLIKDIKKSKEYKDIPRTYKKSKMKKQKLCDTIYILNS